MKSRGTRLASGLVVVALALAACEVGPDYERPSAPTPKTYKEAEGWKKATPADTANRGPWWSVYNDPVLDGLERQIDISNQNLKAAEAAYRQAQAVVAQARASFFPTATLDTTAARSRSPGSSGSSGGRIQNQFTLSLGASWEPDLWGKIRRTVESNVATAQASAADLANARLSAQATLATDYFELRAEDELKRLLDATVIAYTRSFEITRNQYRAGTAAQSDAVQAEALLRTTEAQAINVGVQRAQLEHAVAVLIGKPPADLAIAPAKLDYAVPVMPPGLPSTLLERRPDIAAAERVMASANAQIGVAEAAFYPTLTLTPSFGFSASMIGNLLQASNRVWSLGSDLAETVFDAGARSAQLAQARAVWDQDVASYRQTVLTAFQQVEDQLAALRILEEQAGVQDEAVRLSQRAVELALNEYRAGTVAYTTVITAQTAALSNQETALTIYQNRMVASATLIAALGGGWEAAQLPAADAVESGAPPQSPPAPAPAPATPDQPASPVPAEDKRSWFDRLLDW